MIALAALAAGLVALAVALLARRAITPDDAGRGTIVTRFEPPSGVDPWVAAEIMGAPRSGLGAHILDLAVRGKVRMVEHDADGSRMLGAQYLTVEGTTADDRDLLEALFVNRIFTRDGSTAPVVWFDGDHAVLDRFVIDRVDRAARQVRAAGFRRPPSVPVISVSALAALVSIVTGLAGILSAESGQYLVLLGSALLAFAGGCLSILALIVTMRHRPLTFTGRVLRDHLIGLRLYLEVAEADRFRTLHDVLTTEREPISGGAALALKTRQSLLPWALVTGVPVAWSRHFDYGRRGENL